MRALLTALQALLLSCCLLSGCKETKKTPATTWRPWSEASEQELLSPDSTDTLHTPDTMARTDSLSAADSVALADSLRRASATDTHQVLEGHAGDRTVYLNFSTINGTHVIGNALINGRQIEIAGTHTETDSRRVLHIEESRAEHDSTRIRIEATSTPTGYSGTLFEGSHALPLSLER